MPISESDLQVGDRVVYANQGVCRVTGSTEMEIAGQRQVFIKLSREDDSATVMVPKGKLDNVRRLADPNELKKVFAYFASPVEGPELDWKVRHRSHGERMSEGGLMGLAQVVKSLTTLADLRPLPPKERELYDNARHLLVAEVAAAADLPDGSAEDAVDLAMFPPGQERKKPTLAVALGEDADDLGLDDGLEAAPLDEAGLEGESEEEEAAEESGESESNSEDEADEPKPKAKKAAKEPKAKPAKEPKEPKEPKAKPAKEPKAKAEPKTKAKPAKAKEPKAKAEPKAKPAAKAKPSKKK